MTGIDVRTDQFQSQFEAYLFSFGDLNELHGIQWVRLQVTRLKYENWLQFFPSDVSPGNKEKPAKCPIYQDK